MPNYVRQIVRFKGMHDKLEQLLNLILSKASEIFPDHNVNWINDNSFAFWMETPWSFPDSWW